MENNFRGFLTEFLKFGICEQGCQLGSGPIWLFLSDIWYFAVKIIQFCQISYRVNIFSNGFSSVLMVFNSNKYVKCLEIVKLNKS